MLTNTTRAPAKRKKKAEKNNNQKTMRVKVLDEHGKAVKDGNGKPETVEAVVYDLRSNDCPKDLVKDIREAFARGDGAEIRRFKRENPNCKKAIRQSSARSRRHNNQALNWISQADDWLLCRPYFGGEAYWAATRIGVPVAIVTFTGGRINPFRG